MVCCRHEGERAGLGHKKLALVHGQQTLGMMAGLVHDREDMFLFKGSV